MLAVDEEICGTVRRPRERWIISSRLRLSVSTSMSVKATPLLSRRFRVRAQ